MKSISPETIKFEIRIGTSRISFLVAKEISRGCYGVNYFHSLKQAIDYVLAALFFTPLESTCCIISFGKILNQINAESTLTKIVAMVMVTRSQN